MKMHKMVIESNFKCDFCNKSFIKEGSLVNHSCEKKQRWLEKDSKWSTLGFLAYQKFYKLTNATGKKVQTYPDFMNSRYYTDFIKLGRFLTNQNSIINPEGYIVYLIKNSIKLKDWAYDFTYETYINEVVNQEHPDRGIERSIIYLLDWANANSCTIQEFFSKANTNIVVNDIKGGRLSPWLIYLADTSDTLLDRFDDSQLKMLSKHLNPKVWQIKKARYKQDCEQLKLLLKQYNL